MHADGQSTPVKAKVMVVDGTSMSVIWANEAAAEAFPEGILPPGAGVEQIVPLAAELGVAEALESVAATGEPRHFQADLVSTGRGNVTLVTSAYRLPDGNVLVVTENAWQWTPPGRDEKRTRSRRPGR